jgi:hypothetical protein
MDNCCGNGDSFSDPDRIHSQERGRPTAHCTLTDIKDFNASCFVFELEQIGIERSAATLLRQDSNPRDGPLEPNPMKVVVLRIGENGSDGNQVSLTRFERKRLGERPAHNERTK